jgi:murein DD-endopeptidase MepM/ murein hydrolase activator NlpD
MQKIPHALSEVKEFISSLRNYLWLRVGKAFWWLEGVKQILVFALYRKRGRYAQPFVHSMMAGFIFVSVTFGPLFIAQTFPGQAASVEEILPSEVVIGTTSEVDPDLVTLISEKPRAEVINYEVQGGDTVSSIADKFGVSIDTVLWANDMSEKERIKPGQELNIPPVTGIVHAVRKGDTIYSIAKKYEAEAQAVVDFPFNTFTNDETFALAVGQTIIVPDGIRPDVKPVSPVSTIARRRTPDAGVVSATGNFVWPSSGRISQRFAWYHPGVDIANKAGGAILAADAGRVIVAGWPDNRGYANRVTLDHGNGYQTLYAHMAKVSVSVGQTVNRGDLIGQMGCTGRCTGTHLHFEIRRSGSLVNPLSYLK